MNQNATTQPVASPAEQTLTPEQLDLLRGPQASITNVSPPPLSEGPVQVDASVFLAARLRETMAEAANLRTLVAELQTALAHTKAQLDQNEIDALDSAYNVGKGSILQKRPDGTYWRLPNSTLQQG
jgi:hypothetical protein